ncbi:putative quinol monooxygenase [Novosphingobium album (ex Liu et al. 2023)]|uniref:Quinol monooxygenase n=1 Tax=Novosphingobium album (ex Liu et al. 2023) TaxID=3031130 RepID=A0ABT5WRD9_9SPHN|nr:putative quinol monooxygenase [Novosphingobium album (ex Liu et al. 2023)]MDE8652409.1 putative quinol monooxygenase [Novosphingobium album (ex Liu et al. 2023)]
MILVVATVRVHPDRVEDYAAACRDMMPRLQAANPGILFYHAGRSRDEEATFRVIEAYADREAMERHIGSDMLKASFAGMRDYIADIDIRVHDAIV